MKINNTKISVRLNFANISYSLPGYSQRISTKDYDLWFILKGKGSLQAPNGFYKVFAGDCFIFRPWEKYYFENDTREPMTLIYIHYDYLNSKGQTIRYKNAESPPLYRHFDTSIFFEKILKRILEFQKKEPNKAHLWLEAALIEIQRQDKMPKLSILELKQTRIFNELCEKISHYPGKHYSIRKLARKFHYTSDYFSRLFKKYRGLPLREFIIQTRLKAAKKLLRSSNKSITQIAERLGYIDNCFFSKQFREKTGQTPLKYRCKKTFQKGRSSINCG